MFGANVPAWSPDRKVVVYEIGNENQAVAKVSRIYLQPLGGTRVEGPAFPATNPRFWADGKDTALLWCASGRDDGYKDAASRTLRQRVAGGALTGEPRATQPDSYLIHLPTKSHLKVISGDHMIQPPLWAGREP